jgi:hypothetical protein
VAVAGNKTVETDISVHAFLSGIENRTRRSDGFALLDIMRSVSGEVPRMWGPSIVGFGRYHYRYESGHEGAMLLMGFSPRKANLVLYLDHDKGEDAGLLRQLGKHKTGVSCLYINKLADVDGEALRALVTVSWVRAKAKPTDR